jgi:hypothetical protein
MLHKTGVALIDLSLLALVWFFYPLYEMIVTLFMSGGTRDFVMEFKEVLGLATALLVFIKIVRDLFFKKPKK